TEERFGVKYVCDVLRGVKDKRIKDLGHDKLSVFGICAEMSEDELKYYFNQLLSKGLLQKSEGKYATIMLGEKGREFLRLKQKLLLPRPELKMEIKIKKNKKAGVENYDEELFEELRIIRKLLADKFRVPPYIVFGDVTLKQMAYYRPQTEEAMLEITGVGHEKLKKFGADFLGKIQRYEKKKRV
ncbi:MAG TPA: RQC domain-containing protein, partial [Patescibacteria group bacterium]